MIWLTKFPRKMLCYFCFLRPTQNIAMYMVVKIKKRASNRARASGFLSRSVTHSHFLLLFCYFLLKVFDQSKQHFRNFFKLFTQFFHKLFGDFAFRIKKLNNGCTFKS